MLCKQQVWTNSEMLNYGAFPNNAEKDNREIKESKTRNYIQYTSTESMSSEWYEVIEVDMYI